MFFEYGCNSLATFTPRSSGVIGMNQGFISATRLRVEIPVLT